MFLLKNRQTRTILKLYIKMKIIPTRNFVQLHTLPIECELLPRIPNYVNSNE